MALAHLGHLPANVWVAVQSVALLFGTGDATAANIGRFLQGAGGVFALVGAVYLITKSFPTSLAASSTPSNVSSSHDSIR